MSNTMKLRPAKDARQCRKCKGRAFSVKEYEDAIVAICKKCQYPVREEKS